MRGCSSRQVIAKTTGGSVPQSGFSVITAAVGHNVEEVIDSPSDVDISPRLTVCISDDGDLAGRSVKRYVAHYLLSRTLLRWWSSCRRI